MHWGLFLLIFTLGAAERFFSCEEPKEGQYFDMPSLLDCSVPAMEKKWSTLVALYVRDDQNGLRKAYRCEYVYEEHCMTASPFLIFFKKDTLKVFSRVTPASVEVCRRAVGQQKLRIEVIDEELERRLPAKTHGCQKRTKGALVLTLGTIFGKENGLITSYLGNTDGCSTSAGHCSNKDSTILWEAQTRGVCGYLPLGVFPAVLDKDFITINESGYSGAFQVLNQTEGVRKCFNQMAYNVAGNAIAVLQQPIDSLEEHWKTKELSENSLTNSQRATKVSQQLVTNALIRKDYDHRLAQWSRECASYNRQVQLILNLARTDLTAALRVYLGRSDLVAIPVGHQTAFVARCVWMEAVATFPQHVYNGDCYEWLPVVLQNRASPMFVRPYSQELHSSSPKIDCEENEKRVFILEGKHHNAQGQVQVAQGPEPLHVPQLDSLPVDPRSPFSLVEFNPELEALKDLYNWLKPNHTRRPFEGLMHTEVVGISRALNGTAMDELNRAAGKVATYTRDGLVAAGDLQRRAEQQIANHIQQRVLAFLATFWPLILLLLGLTLLVFLLYKLTIGRLVDLVRTTIGRITPWNDIPSI